MDVFLKGCKGKVVCVVVVDLWVLFVFGLVACWLLCGRFEILGGKKKEKKNVGPD